MHIVRSKNNIVEKTLRDKEGRLVRAIFYVYDVHGVVKARLVRAEFISETHTTEKILSLPFFNIKTGEKSIFSYVYKIQSPFFQNNILNFSGSKPRAPTL